MGELIGALIIIGICWLLTVLPEHKAHNYLPPEGYKIDHQKVNYDLTTGVSREEVNRKMVQGKYNVKK